MNLDTFQSASPKEKEEAKDKFVQIQAAYEILSDEKKKANYDQFGFAGESMGNGQPGAYQYQWSNGGQNHFAEDILRNFFGGNAPKGQAFHGFEDIFGGGFPRSSVDIELIHRWNRKMEEMSFLKYQ